MKQITRNDDISSDDLMATYSSKIIELFVPKRFGILSKQENAQLQSQGGEVERVKVFEEEK